MSKRLCEMSDKQTEVKIESWRRYVNGIIAAEISRLSRYYDRVIQWKPRRNDSGLLLELVDNPNKSVAEDFTELPDASGESSHRSIVLLNGNINHLYDVQQVFCEIGEKLSRSSRIVLIAYNSYYRWLYKFANLFGIRQGEVPDTFVTYTDLHHIAKLANFDIVRVRSVGYCPLRLWRIGDFINALLAALPFVRHFALAAVVVLRPMRKSERPSLSIVIPARNEKGNIEKALERMPDFGGTDLEIIFVEGHSSDGTWDEIERVVEQYKDRFQLKAFQQSGRGKSDAVRLGFKKASKELLTILDADLTMPPELLDRFYGAYCDGLADFINGSRLVYPMEGQAMRFLNHLGNVFFAKALSFVLDTRLGDSLCGTKLVSRSDYERFCRWREDFGDFDPFGDFELLFPAAVLGLGIVDIPIRYRARTYGSTQISRFSHGVMLLKMTVIGFMRIRIGTIKGAGE